MFSFISKITKYINMSKYYIHRNELNEILFLSEIYEGTLELEKDSLVVIKGVSGYSSAKIHFVYETTLNKNYIINDIVYTINEIWPTCTDSCYKVILLDDDKQKSLLIGLDIIDDNLLSTILNTQNIEEKIKEKTYSYPENTSNETLFSVKNDGKIFSNIENKGYHLKDIKKGTLGNISKIEEELEELKDAIEQDCKIMTMVELSDLYGAIRAFVETQGLKMEDLEKFSNITKRAFENGYRN